jgi:hypothetical protein
MRQSPPIERTVPVVSDDIFARNVYRLLFMFLHVPPDCVESDYTVINRIVKIFRTNPVVLHSIIVPQLVLRKLLFARWRWAP